MGKGNTTKFNLRISTLRALLPVAFVSGTAAAQDLVAVMERRTRQEGDPGVRCCRDGRERQGLCPARGSHRRSCECPPREKVDNREFGTNASLPGFNHGAVRHWTDVFFVTESGQSHIRNKKAKLS